MNNREQITPTQFALIIYPITVGTVYFPAAGIVAPHAGSAGWIAVLVGFSISLLWVWMAAQLCRLAPVGNWGAAVFSWIGPWAGRLLLCYFGIIGLWLGAYLLQQGSFVFHSVGLPATPPLALTLSTLLLLVFTDLRGVEVYSRTVQLVLLASLPLIFGFLYGTVPAIQLDNLMPWFGDGVAGIAHAAYFNLPWPMEGAIFVMFFGSLVKDRSKLARNAVAAVALAGLSISAVVFITLGVLGRSVTESYIYSSVPLTFSSGIGQFLQGLEVFVYPLWLYTTYIKTTALFVLTSECLRGIVPAFRQPWRGAAVGIAFLVVTQIPKSLADMVSSVARLDNTVVNCLYGVLPLMLVWVWVKRRKQCA